MKEEYCQQWWAGW